MTDIIVTNNEQTKLTKRKHGCNLFEIRHTIFFNIAYSLYHKSQFHKLTSLFLTDPVRRVTKIHAFSDFHFFGSSFPWKP